MAKAKRKRRTRVRSEAQPKPVDPEAVVTDAVVKSKPYVIGLLVILLLIAVWAVLRERKERADNSASAAAYGALAKIRKDLDKASEKRRELLQRKLRFQYQIEQFRNYPGFNEQRDRLASMFADQIAKTDKELAAANRTYEEKLRECEGKLEQLIKDHPGSGAAKDAEFYLASLEYQLGRYDEAVKRFREFADKHPKRLPLAAFARFGAADALIALAEKDPKAAGKHLADAYEILNEMAKPFSGVGEQVRNWARYRAAFCAALQGKYDVARTNLQALLEAQGADSATRTAAEDLDALLKITPPADFKRLVTSLPVARQAATTGKDVPAPPNKAGAKTTPKEQPAGKTGTTPKERPADK